MEWTIFKNLRVLIFFFFEALDSQATSAYSFIFYADSLGSKSTEDARWVKMKNYIKKDIQ